MNCPVCGFPTKVIDTYPTVESVVRRRQCKNRYCSYRFQTAEYEITDRLPARQTVKKKGEF